MPTVVAVIRILILSFWLSLVGPTVIVGDSFTFSTVMVTVLVSLFVATAFPTSGSP